MGVLHGERDAAPLEQGVGDVRGHAARRVQCGADLTTSTQRAVVTGDSSGEGQLELGLPRQIILDVVTAVRERAQRQQLPAGRIRESSVSSLRISPFARRHGSTDHVSRPTDLARVLDERADIAIHILQRIHRRAIGRLKLTR